MKMYIALCAAALVSCGGGGDGGGAPTPTPTPVVFQTPPDVVDVVVTPTPLTYEFLDEKKWSTTHNNRLVEMTLETACARWQDVEPYACLEKGTERMFHFWLYEDISTDNAPLFFAVGSFELKNEPEMVCFTNIHYWTEVPQDPFMFRDNTDVCFRASEYLQALVIDDVTFTSRPLHE